MNCILFLLLISKFLGTNSWKPLNFEQQKNAVLARIHPPKFSAAVFYVKNKTKTPADFQKEINHAIITCHLRKGGRVVIKPGEYVCNGPIQLLSNVNLHLEKGAIIRFGINPKDYLPVVKVRWEGTICYNYSPLVYANGQKNIAITGEGVLDGQTEKYWYNWKKQTDGNDQERDKKLLREMGEKSVPEKNRQFGEGHKLRPTLIEFFDCENILLENFTARQSPFWTIHPVFSKNITIRGINIENGTTNDDGIDPDSCEDVLIEDCKINTHDDAIAIKAGRDLDAWSKPGTQNIVIRNNQLRTQTNAICIGSEMSGGVQGIWIENCEISSAENGINIKANLDRGGFVRNIWVRNTRIDSCFQAAIRISMDYHGYRGGNFPPDFDELTFENINTKFSPQYGWWLVGVPKKSIGKVIMQGVSFGSVPHGNKSAFVNLKVK